MERWAHNRKKSDLRSKVLGGVGRQRVTGADGGEEALPRSYHCIWERRKKRAMLIRVSKCP